MAYDFNKLTKLPWWHWSHYVRPFINWYRCRQDDRKVKAQRELEANTFKLVTILYSWTAYEYDGLAHFHVYKLYESPTKRRCEFFTDDVEAARRDSMYRWTITSWVNGDFTNHDVVKVHRDQMASLIRRTTDPR